MKAVIVLLRYEGPPKIEDSKAVKLIKNIC